MNKCRAYKSDGTLCGKPAHILLKEKGAMVCVEHALVDDAANWLQSFKARWGVSRRKKMLMELAEMLCREPVMPEDFVQRPNLPAVMEAARFVVSPEKATSCWAEEWDDVVAECDNCGWRSAIRNGVTPIPDLHERIEPGGTVPACECPECGALAYVTRNE